MLLLIIKIECKAVRAAEVLMMLRIIRRRNPTFFSIYAMINQKLNILIVV